VLIAAVKSFMVTALGLVNEEQRREGLVENQGQYKEHFIFFVTYKWDQKVRVFELGKPLQTNTM
jgi:hypothetical protein